MKYIQHQIDFGRCFFVYFQERSPILSFSHMLELNIFEEKHLMPLYYQTQALKSWDRLIEVNKQGLPLNRKPLPRYGLSLTDRICGLPARRAQSPVLPCCRHPWP